MKTSLKVFSFLSLLTVGTAALVGTNVATTKAPTAVAAEGEMTSTTVSLNQIEFRFDAGARSYRMLFKFNTPWTNEGATNNAAVYSPSLTQLNTLSKIHYEFKDGSSYTLSELTASDHYYQKIWGEDAFAVEGFGTDHAFNAKINDLVHVVIDEGCEFPKYGSDTEKYVLDTGYVALSNETADVNGNMFFNNARGNLSKVTNRGTMMIHGLGDPGFSNDGNSMLWINSNVSEWKSAAANTVIGWRAASVANFSTHVLINGETIASHRGADRRFPGYSNQLFFHKWAREGTHFSFDPDYIDGLYDYANTITILKGATFPGVKNIGADAAGDYEVWTTDATYTFEKVGEGKTWEWRLVDVEGDNVTTAAPTHFNWAKFGDGNVWAMIGLPGIDKANSDIEACNAPIGDWECRKLVDSLDFAHNAYLDDANSQGKLHTNLGCGGHSKDDAAIHYNVTHAVVDAATTFVVKAGTVFPKAANFGKGAEGSKPGFVKLAKPVVAINRNGTWVMAEVEEVVPQHSVMYVGNQNAGTTTDFAFYVDGLSPETRVGDDNRYGVYTNTVGKGVLAAADLTKNILIDGARIPNTIGGDINWWGRGGNYFGMSTTYEAAKTTVETMTLKRGIMLPTKKTCEGTENKVIFVPTDRTFSYKFVEGAKYQEVMTVEQYDQYLSNYIGTVCNFAAEDDYGYEATTFTNMWKYAKRVYSAMDAADKAALATSTGAGVEKYDFLCAKYNLENFLGRASVNGLRAVNVEESNSNLIAVVSVFSVAAIAAGAFFYLNKKKHQN